MGVCKCKLQLEIYGCSQQEKEISVEKKLDILNKKLIAKGKWDPEPNTAHEAKV